MRRTLIGGVAGGLMVLLAALALVPVLFEDELAARATRVVSRAMGSEVTVADPDLVFWKRFPRVFVGLTDVRVAGSAPFREDTFLEADRVEVAFDLLDVLQGDYTAREVQIQHPVLHAVSGAGDTSNFDFGGDPSEPSGDGVSLRIEHLGIEDMTVRWSDREGGLEAIVEDVDLTGRGAVDGEAVSFDTSTQIAEITVTAKDETWVHELTLEATGDASYGLDTGELRLAGFHGALNALPVALDARIQPTHTDFDVELELTAPDATVAGLISLLPPSYRGELDAVQTTGEVVLSMEAAGRLDAEHDDYPELSGQLTLTDGSYTTADLPGTAEDLQLRVAFAHPQGPLNGTTVDVQRAHFTLDDSSFEARARITEPFTDPLVDLDVDAVLDLASVAATFPVEGFEGRGRVDLDLRAAGRQRSLTGLDTGAIALEGQLEARDLRVQTDLVPLPVRVEWLESTFDGRTTELSTFVLSFGETAFAGRGQLTNLFGYALEGAALGGHVTIDADTLDLTPFMADDGPAEAETGVLLVPEELDVAVGLTAREVLLESMAFGDLDGTVRLARGTMEVEGLGLDVVGGRAVVSGSYAPSSTQAAEVDLSVDARDLELAEATTTFTSLARVLPASSNPRGRFGGDLSVRGTLDGEMAFVPDSLQADGVVRAGGVALRPAALQTLSARLGRDDLSQVRIGSGRLGFEVVDGRATLQPADLTLGALAATVAGTVGVVDQALGLTLDTEVPSGGIAQSLLAGLAGNVPDAVPVTIRVGGTVLDPTLGVDLREAKGAVSGALRGALDEPVGETLDQVEAKTDAWLATARREADRLVARAERQAQRLRSEADQQASQLVEQAGANPLLVAGAKEAGKEIRRKADQVANKLVRQARKKADAVIDRAEARRDAALAEARRR